jgi:hypothetical protein
MAKMTRGEMQDLLRKFAAENPKYRQALLSDPKGIVERQFNISLGDTKVKAVEETADTLYVVVPHVAAEGQLDDADLEKVAGGFLDEYNVECGDGALNSLIQLSL